LSGNTPLDKALQQLIVSSDNPKSDLSICIDEDRRRLNQRFAYLALMFSTNGKDRPSWFGSPNECAWTGITCNGNTVTKLELSYLWLEGTIPDDVGLWTGLTDFNVYGNALAGSLPSSIGAWTGLTWLNVGFNNFVGSLPSSIGLWTGLRNFDVGSNQLVGIVPKEVSKWTFIQEAYFDTNMFVGTMPIIGNTFCPKNRTGGKLWADCFEIKCACCNTCFL
jgi:hypothetical protein